MRIERMVAVIIMPVVFVRRFFFRRRVMVEGSADGTAWDRVADDLYLFAIDLPDRKIRVDTLPLPK